MSNPVTESRLLNVAESAKVLHVAPITVRRHLKHGTLSHVRIGKKVLFRASDLAAFIEKHAVAATSS